MIPVTKVTLSVCVLVCLFGFVSVAMGMPLDRDDENDNKETMDLDKRGQGRVCYQKPVEIGIVLDSSGSITIPDFDKAKDFLDKFLSHFDIGTKPTDTRVSIIPYGRDVYKEQAFNLDKYRTKNDVLEAIKRIQHRRGTRTDTGLGIEYMRKSQLKGNMVRPQAHKVGLVITDGQSQDKHLTERQGEEARNDDITMYAIGVGEETSITELLKIAGDMDRVVRVDSYTDLYSIKDSLAKRTCDKIEKEDENKIEKMDEICYQKPVELGIVLDSSSSIWKPDFDKAKEFLDEFLSHFDIGTKSTHTRVSIIPYGKGVYIEQAFNLDKYRTKNDVLAAIKRIQHRAGQRTDTGLGIEYMRKSQLGGNMVRPQAHKVGLVITDGQSQDQQRTERQGKEARNDNITMYAIGVGEKVNITELLKIAGDMDRVVRVDNYMDLYSIKDSLAKRTCEKIEKEDENKIDKKDEICSNEPIELGIVFDTSVSIEDIHFIKAKEFLIKFLYQFHIGNEINDVRVSIIPYGAGVYTQDAFNLNTYQTKEDVLEAIERIKHKYGGSTDTGHAIQYMREKQLRNDLVRPQARKISLVFTDGNSQKWHLTDEEAAKARDDGITMFAIGVGKNITTKELLKIAGTEDRVTRVDNFDQLDSIKETLGKSTCIICYHRPIEIGIVLDSSTSIWEVDFKKAKEFLVKYLDQFNIGTGRDDARASIIIYGDVVYTEDAFNLDTYRTKKEVLDAIDRIKHKYGNSTHTGPGIKYMRENQLNTDVVRPQADKIGLVLTDGEWHDTENTTIQAKMARDDGITMFAIGVGDKVSREELLKIAGVPDHVTHVDNFSDLDDFDEILAKKTCKHIRARDQDSSQS